MSRGLMVTALLVLQPTVLRLVHNACCPCSWWVILIPVVVVVLLISLVGGALARSRRMKAAPAVGPAAYAGQTAYPVQPGSNYANYGPGYYNGFGSTGMAVMPPALCNGSML